MLRALDEDGAGKTQVVVCSTCRHTTEAREDGEGLRGGARLAAALREVKAAEEGFAGVEVQDMPCLFACKRFCTIHIRAPGKVGYVLGDFSADAEAARAILTYAAAHAQSEEGVVRYAHWPDGVKGHFITRTPPEGYLCT